MPKKSSKYREWEKERRNRLNEAFTTLSKLLPSYDPSINTSKIDILKNATTYIQELQTKIKELLSENNEETAKKTRVEEYRKLHERIKRLLSKNEQLCALLREAKITIPPGCIFTRKIKASSLCWSDRILPEQAKILQEKELEKENDSTVKKATSRKFPTKKQNKVGVQNSTPKHRKAIINRSDSKKIRTAKKKKIKASPPSKCVIVLSQPSITQSCYVITNAPSNNVLGGTSTVITNSNLIASPLVSSKVTKTINPTAPLGPGTLILANGTIMPVLPQTTVLPLASQIITRPPIILVPKNSVNVPNSTTTTTTITTQLTKIISSNVKNVTRIRPKYCLTKTTQVNKVPIPALTSRYSNVDVVLKKTEPKSNKTKAIEKKSTSENDNRVEVQKVGEKRKSSSMEEASAQKKNNVAEENSSKKVEESINVNGKENEEHILEPEKVQNQNEKDTEKKDNEKEKINQESINKVQEQEIRKPEETLELNINHSELSNDIFASLQVPSGCQNPESTSPTAAFLLAFPLVSSLTGVKVTEVMEEDNTESQRGTPTLLQIGTMDSTKPTQSETLTPSLLNLDNLSFFSSKDMGGFYSSFENSLATTTTSTVVSAADPVVATKKVENELQKKVEYQQTKQQNQQLTPTTQQPSSQQPINQSQLPVTQAQQQSQQSTSQPQQSMPQPQQSVQHNHQQSQQSVPQPHQSVQQSQQSVSQTHQQSVPQSHQQSVPQSHQQSQQSVQQSRQQSQHSIQQSHQQSLQQQSIQPTQQPHQQTLQQTQQPVQKSQQPQQPHQPLQGLQQSHQPQASIQKSQQTHQQPLPSLQQHQQPLQQTQHQQEKNQLVPCFDNHTSISSFNNSANSITYQAKPNVENKQQTVPTNNYNTQKVFTCNNFNETPKVSTTCSYINSTKSYPEPLYTNSSTYSYNNSSELNFNQSYYKDIPKSDNRNNYSLNYENYADYRKNDSSNTYFSSSNYYSNTSYSKDKFNMNGNNNQKNKNSNQNSQSRAPINWMTTPDNRLQTPSDYVLPHFSKQADFYASNTFTNTQTTYFNTNPMYPTNTNEVGGNPEPRKSLDLALVPSVNSYQRNDADDNQFSWSPTKIPQLLDPPHSFVSSTLPTLVGDLALGNPLTFSEQKGDKCQQKKDTRRLKTYENNPSNFLSVSQLVDHNKEVVPARTTTRRNSGNRSSGKKVPQKTSQRKEKEVNYQQKIENPGKGMKQYTSSDVFCDNNKNRNAKNSYSAEALIGQMQSDVNQKNRQNYATNKPIPFLHDNIIPYFPTMDLPQDNSYMQQNQNYQTSSFGHNFQNSSYTANTFIPATTINSSYNFMHDVSHDYSENLNLFPQISKEKNCGKNTNRNVKEQQCPTTPKKSKRKHSNEMPGFVDFPFLSMPGSINSPILPDDFHTHTGFLQPPTPQLYPCKNPFTKSNELPSGSLLPLPPVPVTRSNIQHPEISPSINSAGTSLTNFNLSTIFPEINNKSALSDPYTEIRGKEQTRTYTSTVQVSFNEKPTFSLSYINGTTSQPYNS